MTTNDIEQIKARVERATPEPWIYCPDGLGMAVFYVDSEADHMQKICETPAGDERDADMAFIWHARDDIPALVAEVEELRRADDRYKALRAVAFQAVEAHYHVGSVGMDHQMSNLRAALEDIEYFVWEGFGKTDETP